MEYVIWRFRTRGGSVRLGIGVAVEDMKPLHEELRGCAAVADTYDEFIAMAGRAVGRHSAVVGDIFRQPWPVIPFGEKVRKAAMEPSTVKAATALVDAAMAAESGEIREFLCEPGGADARAFTRDLVRSLDEEGNRFVADLAAALAVSAEDLVSYLDA